MSMKSTPWEDAASMRARALELFSEYDLARVRTPHELTTRIAEITGKPIRIEKLDDPALVHTTALWIEYEELSKVVLRATDRVYYQVRGLHHEFGHMLWGHPGCEGLSMDDGIRRLAGAGQVRGRVLMTPNSLSPLAGDALHEGEAEAMGEIITRSLLRPEYFNDERIFG
ncbi:hypothetical protein [Microbacterium maritypicum]|uniref:IrrE N-terminal-like domain-containing protein n=1 Tax=Microbacterium maritypicum MF109 TaxID=1333857 RepID=T5K4F2_MICMQ|nr:hypothetical protein [Microbacterium liquefaciens]EQM74756.1 hypothetical protein L687_04650 [Microbacterium maritypicum MF109]